MFFPITDSEITRWTDHEEHSICLERKQKGEPMNTQHHHGSVAIRHALGCDASRFHRCCVLGTSHSSVYSLVCPVATRQSNKTNRRGRGPTRGTSLSEPVQRAQAEDPSQRATVIDFSDHRRRRQCPLCATNGHRCRKISNLHGVLEIALLSREIAFFRPIARRRLP